MSVTPKQTKATLIPCLRYRDAPAAIDWLCATFGFQRQLVVPGEDGSIVHAQLTFGNGMIMLGSVRADGSAYSNMMKQPDEIGGCETQTICVVVDDADIVHRRVVDAGMPVVIPIADADYGGRGFSCRDLEGHIWHIGTYDPFA